ncbi:MAG: glycosyltransferase [Eubacteriales bacterium]|nr:glycosyltransferase [Eubacteriales bacterium]
MTDSRIACNMGKTDPAKRRVLFYATTAYMIDQFNMMNIRMLQDMGLAVDVACNFEHGNPVSPERLEAFKRELDEAGIDRIQLDLTRNIFDLIHNGSALGKSIRLMRERKYAFVHCHTPVGAVIARLACRATGTKVIYTAHGFHFFKGAPLLNWLVYYPIEKFFSGMTDVLITINKEDYDRARAKFHMKKLEYVPGVGIDMSRYEAPGRNRIRAELGIPDDAILMVTVGELSKRKNQIAVLKALAKLESEAEQAVPAGAGKQQGSEAEQAAPAGADKPAETKADERRAGLPDYRFAIAGTGIYKEELQKFIDENGLAGKVMLLGFRTDIPEICRAADAFVFPSFQEGLPVALMEAMACGLPAAVSRIRGNADLIDENGGILFDLDKENKGVEEALLKLLSLSQEERRAYGAHNAEVIRRGFSTEAVKQRLQEIYERVL